METLASYLGPILALLTAVCWAFAVILFKRSGETVHPIGLNLFKAFLAISLLLPTIWISRDTLFPADSLQNYGLVLVSGMLGIGIADTLFFRGLNAIGAGRIAIVDCLYSPFVIGLSILFLAESLSFWQFVGAVMIISAVLTLTGEPHSGVERSALVKGILLGVLAIACTSASLVMVKPILERSPLLWVSTWRMIGGAAVLVLVLSLHRGRREILGSLVHARGWIYTLGGSFMGAYLSTLLWLGGMKYTQASVAAALNQTSNVFIFIFAAMFLKERVTPLRTAGIVLAVAGAFLVMFG